jgi:hypothetical protein
MFTTICCLLLPTAYSFTFTEKHICHFQFYECTEQGAEQKQRGVCEEYISHRATDQILEQLRPFILLLRHGYCVLKNIKSICGLVIFKGKK